jgi:prefoldin beta subunit
MATTASTPADLQALTDTYNGLSTKISSTLQTLQGLEAQRTENASVSKEFGSLETGVKVYKLVGPVLVKQSLEEAKSTVEGRMGFIETQIGDVEKQIGELKGQQEQVKGEVRLILVKNIPFC